MAGKLSWGGIRGRGMKIRSDATMSIIAFIMATAVIIIAFFIFERGAVQVYVDQTAKVVTNTDESLETGNRLWNSDLFTIVSNPLLSSLDTVDARAEGESWQAQLAEASTDARTERSKFEERPAPPNASSGLESEIRDYLKATETYVTDESLMTAYFKELIAHEMNMNEAVKAAPYAQGQINPALLQQRDAIMETELAAIKQLKPPPSLKDFHRDNLQFLEDYVGVSKQTTIAYMTNAGLARLETLGAEGQRIVTNAKTTLDEDIADIKTGQLGRDSKLARAHKDDTRDEIARLKKKYRF